MKKYVIASIILCLVASLALAIYFVVPKRQDDPTLVVDASNVDVCVGDSAPIEYVCSIKSASVSFEVEDKSIATTKMGSEGVEVLGVSQGTTKMMLTARYNSKECEKIIEIIVKQKDISSTPPNDDENGENPNGGEAPPNGGAQNPDDGKESAPENGENDKPEISFLQENMINCRFEDGKLMVETSIKAVFSITASEGFSTIDIDNQNLHITIAEDYLLGNNSYSIIATQAGEFEIKIILDGKHEYIVVVHVFE